MAIGAMLSSSSSSSRALASPLSYSSSAAPGKQQHHMTMMMIRHHSSTSPHTRWLCSPIPGDRNGNSQHVVRSAAADTQLNSPTMRLCNSAGLVRRRVLSKVECFLSSDPVTNGWQKPKNLAVTGPHRVPVRKRADCRAEQYEMTGAPLNPDVPAAVLVGDAQPWWQQLPKRWIIVVLCFFSFLLCNMDRVNMSIAILPMSAEFGWSPATVGLIQSSFFWGYLLTQILGGIWADRFGGKVVLGFGVVWWSIATILTPFAAKLGLPCLLVVRAFMGIGEGVAMPAMNNILSKWIPVSERSRSLALVYSGMYLGSVTGLAFSPFLISKFGWPSVFYGFGSLGSIWFALWQLKARSSPSEDPEITEDEKRHILGGNTIKEPVESIPWKLILSKAPVWALIISHFCHNWGTFILLTWMPTYYNQVLKFNLTESGLLCVLPWLTMAVFANIGGWIADTLVAKGVSITNVRKIMQSIGFLGPALFLTLLSKVRTPAMAVLCMACSQGSDAFSQSGLYSNHQDIGPRYAVMPSCESSLFLCSLVQIIRNRLLVACLGLQSDECV